MNSSENTKCKNLEDAAKVELRGKLIALSSKLDKSKDHKSITSASKLGNKEGQMNLKVSSRKELFEEELEKKICSDKYQDMVYNTVIKTIYCCYKGIWIKLKSSETDVWLFGYLFPTMLNYRAVGKM